MVVTVGGMEEARALMKKLKMPDVEWMKPGRVQRSWYVRQCAKQPAPGAGPGRHLLRRRPASGSCIL